MNGTKKELLNDMKKEKIEYLSFYRAFAILAVVLIHATSQTIAAAQTSDLYYMYVFANIFSKFAVPSFIFLTGFVLFYNYADRGLNLSNIGAFYRKRLKYILIPYFIFSLAYFLFRQFLNGGITVSMESMTALIEDLLTGTAYTHLYYIFILVQFYLLFPLHLAASRSKTFVKYSIVIGLVIQWAFILLNKYELQIPQKGSLFLSYISFWMFGAYIGMNWNRCKQWLQSLFNPETGKAYRWWNAALWISWMLSALAHVQAWYTYNLGLFRMNSLWYEALFNVHSMLSCLVLIQASSLIYRRGRGLGARLFNQLGEISFGIYLMHPFFLFIYRKWEWHGGSSILYPIYIASGFVFALGCSWLLIVLISRWVPGASWVLFGNPSLRPSTSANKKKANIAG